MVEQSSSKRQRRRKCGWDLDAPQLISRESPQLLQKQQQEINRLIEQLAMQRKALALQSTATGGISCRIYVGSIHYELKELDIVKLFSTFGVVTKSEMTLDPLTGRSKGFCFIEFADSASAEAAMAMDGFELAGRKIKVGRPHHSGGNYSTAAAAQLMQTGLGAAPSFGTMGGLSMPSIAESVVASNGSQQGAAAPSTEEVLNTILISNIQDGIGEPELRAVFAAFGAIDSCDVVEGSNCGTTAAVQFSDAALAASVAASMQGFDLAGSALNCQLRSYSAAIGKLQLQKAQSSEKNPLCSVLLLNMVTIEDAKDPELKDEIAEEASTHGNLLDVDIQIASDNGSVKVLLRYADPDSARTACNALNGRAFAGNSIIATLQP